MENLRLFIAIELSCFLRKKIQKIQDYLKKTNSPIVWVKPENIHLTLKFLGEIPKDKVDLILKVMVESAELFPDFTFKLNKLGAFPKLEHPQIIWAGVEKGYAQIENIFLELEGRLEKIGFKKESCKFSAHITLGRLRSPDNCLPLLKTIRNFKILKDFEQTVKEITLFQSTLTPHGPVYKILGKAELITP